MWICFFYKVLAIKKINLFVLAYINSQMSHCSYGYTLFHAQRNPLMPQKQENESMQFLSNWSVFRNKEKETIHNNLFLWMSGMTVHFNFVASSNYIWGKYFILRVLLNLFKDLVLCVHEITHYFLSFRNSNCGKSYKLAQIVPERHC